jgi:anion-transporting  ArsA/GET3 family ATPase
VNAVTQTNNAHLAALLGQRLVVCVGCGGVGKTTTAAALALAAAQQGRRAAVITVDPARRLKDALGLESLDTQPRPIPLGNSSGTLDALALDTKRTFDALIARVAPSEDVAQRILANRMYQQLSNELGGSTEYMAMEKLYELLHLDRYDIIVVDTAPSAHARDMLRAPLKLIELLASSAIRFLKSPSEMLGGNESGLARMTVNAIFKALQRWTGLNVLSDLADFAGNFEGLVAGFRARAAEVDQTLRQPTTSFVLVTTPEPDTVSTTVEFLGELEQEQFPVAGVIANRTYDFPPRSAVDGMRFPEPLRRKLLANYDDLAALAERDRAALARLRKETKLKLLAVLPVLAEPPTSMASLRQFAALLAASG